MPKDRKISQIYDYFVIRDDSPLEAICKACNEPVARGGKTLAHCGTTNLMRHLKRRHTDLWIHYEARVEERKSNETKVEDEDRNGGTSSASSSDYLFQPTSSDTDHAMATAQVLTGTTIDALTNGDEVHCAVDGHNETDLSQDQYRSLKRRQLELDVEIKELTAKHLKMQIYKLSLELKGHKNVDNNYNLM